MTARDMMSGRGGPACKCNTGDALALRAAVRFAAPRFAAIHRPIECDRSQDLIADMGFDLTPAPRDDTRRPEI